MAAPRIIVALTLCLGLAVGLAAAGPSRYNSQDICPMTCQADGNSGRLNLVPGETLRYKYDTKTDSGLEQSSSQQEKSSIYMTADVLLHVITPCRFVLEIENPTLEEELSGGRRQPSSGGKHLLKELQKSPLVFNYENGKIVRICPSSEESAAALNIKRGVISMMQNNMRQFNRDQTLSEDDVNGKCRTEYTTSKGWASLVIKKEKKLSECDNHESLLNKVLLNSKLIQDNGGRSSSIVNATQICEQTIKDQMINSVACHERHIIRPLSQSGTGNSVATTIQQNLAHVSTMKGAFDERKMNGYEVISSSKGSESIYFDSEHLEQALSEQNEHSVIEAMNAFVQKVTVEGTGEDTAVIFGEMLRAMRRLNQASLERVFTYAMQQTSATGAIYYKKVVLDALRDVSTSSSLRLLAKLHSQGAIDKSSLNSWIMGAALLNDVDTETIRDLLPLVEEGNMQGFLAVSTMTRRFCVQNPEGCENDVAVRQFVTRLYDTLEHKCQTGKRNEDKMQILANLKAIANIGLPLGRKYQILYTCLRNQNLDKEVRVAAVDAFRRFSCSADRSKLMNHLMNHFEDVELRVASYVALIRCPTENTIDQLRKVLHSEISDQVGSFIFSHIKNLKKNPSFTTDVSSVVKDSLLEKKFGNEDKLTLSRNYYYNMFFDPLDAGFEVDGHTLFTSESSIPRHLYLNSTVDIFGRNVNLFEIGLRTENVEQVISRFMEDKGVSELEIPQIAAYVRLFGDEILYRQVSTSQVDESHLKQWWSIIEKLGSSEGLTMSKSMMLIDTEILIPTGTGLPISLTLNGTSHISASLKAHMRQADGIHTFDIHAAPKTEVAIGISMAVVAGQARSGVSMTASASSGWTVEGQFDWKQGSVAKVSVRAPQKENNLISVKTNTFLFNSNEEQKTIGLKSMNHIQNTICTGKTTHALFGHKVCLDMSIPKMISSKSELFAQALTGPKHFNVRLIKTDEALQKFEAEIAHYHREGISDRAVIRVGTPDTKIDREFKMELFNDISAKKFHIELDAPMKKVHLEGQYNFNWYSPDQTGELTNKLEMKLSIDGADLYKLNANLKSAKQSARGGSFPFVEHVHSLELRRANGGQVFNLQSSLSVSANNKLDGKLRLEGLTDTPIELELDMQNAGSTMRRFNTKITSYLLTADVKLGVNYGDDKTLSAEGKFSVPEMKDQEFSYRLASKKQVSQAENDPDKYSVIMKFSNTLNPYFNTDLRYTLQIKPTVEAMSANWEHTLQLALAHNTPNQYDMQFSQMLEARLTKSQLTTIIGVPSWGVDHTLAMGYEMSGGNVRLNINLSQQEKTLFLAAVKYVRSLPMSIDAKLQMFEHILALNAIYDYSAEQQTHALKSSLQINDDKYVAYHKMVANPEQNQWTLTSRVILPNNEKKDTKVVIASQAYSNYALSVSTNVITASDGTPVKFAVELKKVNDGSYKAFAESIDHVTGRNYKVLANVDATSQVLRGKVEYFEEKQKLGIVSISASIQPQRTSFKINAIHKSSTVLDASADLFLQPGNINAVLSIRNPSKLGVQLQLTHNGNIRGTWIISPKADITLPNGQQVHAHALMEVTLFNSPTKKISLNGELKSDLTGDYTFEGLTYVSEKDWNFAFKFVNPKATVHSFSTAGVYEVDFLRTDYPSFTIDGTLAVHLEPYVDLKPVTFTISQTSSQGIFTLATLIEQTGTKLFKFQADGKMTKKHGSVDTHVEIDMGKYQGRSGLSMSLDGDTQDGLKTSNKLSWKTGKEQEKHITLDGLAKINGRELNGKINLQTPFDLVKNMETEMNLSLINNRYEMLLNGKYETMRNSYFWRSDAALSQGMLDVNIASSIEKMNKISIMARWGLTPVAKLLLDVELPNYQKNSLAITMDNQKENRYQLQAALKVPNLYPSGELVNINGDLSVDTKTLSSINGQMIVKIKEDEKMSIQYRGEIQPTNLNGNIKVQHKLERISKTHEMNFDIKRNDRRAFDSRMWIATDTVRQVDIHNVLSFDWNKEFKHQIELSGELLEKWTAWKTFWMSNRVMYSTDSNNQVAFETKLGKSATDLIGNLELNARHESQGNKKIVQGDLTAKLFDTQVNSRANLVVTGRNYDDIDAQVNVNYRKDQGPETEILNAKYKLEKEGIELKGELNLGNMRKYGISLKSQLKQNEHFMVVADLSRHDDATLNTKVDLRVPLQIRNGNNAHLRLTLPHDVTFVPLRNFNVEAIYNKQGHLQLEGSASLTKNREYTSKLTVGHEGKYNWELQGEMKKNGVEMADLKYTMNVNEQGDNLLAEGHMKVSEFLVGIYLQGNLNSQINLKITLPNENVVQLNGMWNEPTGYKFSFNAFVNNHKMSADATYLPAQSRADIVLNYNDISYQVAITADSHNGDITLSMPQRSVKLDWTGGRGNWKLSGSVERSNGEKHNIGGEVHISSVSQRIVVNIENIGELNYNFDGSVLKFDTLFKDRRGVEHRYNLAASVANESGVWTAYGNLDIVCPHLFSEPMKGQFKLTLSRNDVTLESSIDKVFVFHLSGEFKQLTMMKFKSTGQFFGKEKWDGELSFGTDRLFENINGRLNLQLQGTYNHHTDLTMKIVRSNNNYQFTLVDGQNVVVSFALIPYNKFEVFVNNPKYFGQGKFLVEMTGNKVNAEAMFNGKQYLKVIYTHSEHNWSAGSVEGMIGGHQLLIAYNVDRKTLEVKLDGRDIVVFHRESNKIKGVISLNKLRLVAEHDSDNDAHFANSITVAWTDRRGVDRTLGYKMIIKRNPSDSSLNGQIEIYTPLRSWTATVDLDQANKLDAVFSWDSRKNSEKQVRIMHQTTRTGKQIDSKFALELSSLDLKLEWLASHNFDKTSKLEMKMDLSKDVTVIQGNLDWEQNKIEGKMIRNGQVYGELSGNLVKDGEQVEMLVYINNKPIKAILNRKLRSLTLDVNERSLYVDGLIDRSRVQLVISHLHQEQPVDDLRIILASPNERSLKSRFVWRREAVSDIKDHLIEIVDQVSSGRYEELRSVIKQKFASAKMMIEKIRNDYSSFLVNFEEDIALFWEGAKATFDTLTELYRTNTWYVKSTVEKGMRIMEPYMAHIQQWTDRIHFRLVKALREIRYTMVDNLVAIGGDGYRKWLLVEKEFANKYNSVRKQSIENLKRLNDIYDQIDVTIQGNTLVSNIVSFVKQFLIENELICMVSEKTKSSSYRRQQCGITYSTHLQSPSSDHGSFEANVVLPQYISVGSDENARRYYKSSW